MTENLSSPPPADVAPSILAPRNQVRVRLWVLLLAVVIAFGGGWATSLATQTRVESSCACSELPAATPTPTPEVDTEDDSVFVDLATRDIDDFAKDLGDMQTTLDENGYWRLLSNSIELNFNVNQLRGHEAPASIEDDWNDQLAELQANVDDIVDGVNGRSDKKIRAAIVDARDTVALLRETVSRVD